MRRCDLFRGMHSRLLNWLWQRKSRSESQRPDDVVFQPQCLSADFFAQSQPLPNSRTAEQSNSGTVEQEARTGKHSTSADPLYAKPWIITHKANMVATVIVHICQPFLEKIHFLVELAGIVRALSPPNRSNVWLF